MSVLGIRKLGSYIPTGREFNVRRLADFEVDEAFLENKLGVVTRSIKAIDETTTDLCVRAWENLQTKGAPAAKDIDCVVVVTQNPGLQIPHVSATLHGRLQLSENCACFDISLGCSGYVYGLATIESFMAAQGLKNGLLFTADPYSPIIDASDKNTSLLFGDAATVTWIGSDPAFKSGRFTFGTFGAEHGELTCSPGGKLYMNGRAIFNFAAHYVPADIRKLAASNGIELNDIDRFIFHQGSKYIVDTLTRLLQLAPDRVALDLRDYGNTVSSSIPLILAREIEKPENRRLALCGFGAGLSWASALLTRNSNV
jgi:3-oxoacyl-[acyl-carrier-protein] synthase-3